MESSDDMKQTAGYVESGVAGHGVNTAKKSGPVNLLVLFQSCFYILLP
jgi:hypothetical protein